MSTPPQGTEPAKHLFFLVGVASTILACAPGDFLGLLPGSNVQPAGAVRFDREEFRLAMEKLDTYYAAPEGLQRPNGLSIDQRPDFEGIAAWIFDVYLTSRAAGLSPQLAWQNVVAQVERSQEWAAKHPGVVPSTPFTPYSSPVVIAREELLEAMHRLDRYYASKAGLQRPQGLSIGGRPDFEGIAAWAFDVYLNSRLDGASIDTSWQRIVAAIESSDEWRGKPHPPVDASTLHGKHLMGYQGWFGTPADGGGAWVHWFAGSPRSEDATFDVWPDNRELDPDELADTQMTLRGGGRAKLWSSHNRKTVTRHFRWMKEADIDGVSIGRFSVGTRTPDGLDEVLRNVREGAEASGRVFFVWYDVTGHSQSTFVADIKADWERLVRQVGITRSPAYLHHKDRPLLGVWGVGIGDRPGTPADWMDLVTFFKSHPDHACRVTLLAGGIPGWSTDPVWGPVFKSMDVISPWTVGAFGDDAGADNFAREIIAPDIATTRALGLDYMPIAFPGFSWRNLQQKHGGSPLNVFPRRGGRFYWKQVYNIVSAGGTNLFTAMFDEVDEGTAMIKAAPSRDQAPVEGEWLTLDADGERLSSDFYLRLGGAARQALNREISLTQQVPIRPY